MVTSKKENKENKKNRRNRTRKSVGIAKSLVLFRWTVTRRGTGKTNVVITMKMQIKQWSQR